MDEEKSDPSTDMTGGGACDVDVLRVVAVKIVVAGFAAMQCTNQTLYALYLKKELK